MKTNFLEILSEEDIFRALDQVYAKRNLWSPKSALLYTLGEAIYQNVQNMDNYYRSAARLNPVLWNDMSWLYKKLVAALAAVLDGPVQFYYSIALPGYHIFLFDRVLAYDGGGAHFDIQYVNLEWPPGVSVSNEEVVSFTLPLAIPQSGAGIEFWDLAYGPYAASAHHAEIRRAAEERGSKIYQYVPGQLAIFFGTYWHRIARVTGVHSGDRRVTLQGHCIKVNGNWIAYW